MVVEKFQISKYEMQIAKSQIRTFYYYILHYYLAHSPLGRLLSFIDPERGGFGVIFPEVMIFSEPRAEGL
jgi:hypothetical protein